MIAEGFSPQKSGKPACTDADIKAFGLYFHLIQKGRNAFPLEKRRPVFRRRIFPAAIHFFTAEFTHLLQENRQFAEASTIPLFKRDFPNKKKIREKRAAAAFKPVIQVFDAPYYYYYYLSIFLIMIDYHLSYV